MEEGGGRRQGEGRERMGGDGGCESPCCTHSVVLLGMGQRRKSGVWSYYPKHIGY